MDTDTNRVAERPTGRGTAAEFGSGLDPHGPEDGRDGPGATVVDDRTVVADGDRSERSYTGFDAVVETVAASAHKLVPSPQSRPERSVETDCEQRVYGPY
ncbi:hypothetical protein [Haloterrigena salifodinae]|uniref:hypothetical protein n=1 Tax=Haloterrigena salifodinae TaxID=2675099 RepID=UPI000F87BAF8|nr:hypothetical protein [Haloterrigena salifodinae]